MTCQERLISAFFAKTDAVIIIASTPHNRRTANCFWFICDLLMEPAAVPWGRHKWSLSKVLPPLVENQKTIDPAGCHQDHHPIERAVMANTSMNKVPMAAVTKTLNCMVSTPCKLERLTESFIIRIPGLIMQ